MLHGQDEIEDRFEAVEPDGDFCSFNSSEGAPAEAGSEVRFAAVTGFNFSYDHGLATIELNSVEDVAHSFVSDSEEGPYVRWIFVEQAVTIDTECREGEREMSLDLSAGWNAVIVDAQRLDNTTSSLSQYTDDLLGGIEWCAGTSGLSRDGGMGCTFSEIWKSIRFSHGYTSALHFRTLPDRFSYPWSHPCPGPV